MREIFSTTERLRILEAVVFRRGRISVNETANRLRLSKGLVSKYLDFLASAGIAKRHGGKFTIVETAPLVKGIKVLLNLQRFPARVLRKYPFVKAAGLYGSCAKGENTDESDMDIWIQVAKVEERELAALTSALAKTVAHAKVLLLSDGKLEQLKRQDELFYHALSFGSITVFGGRDALQL